MRDDGAAESATPSQGNDTLTSPFFAPGPSWLDVLPKSKHVDLVRRTDYGSLGSLSEWGPALRFYTSMVFADSRNAGLYWGPERIAIYNEGLSQCLGEAHPRLLGHTLARVLPDSWSVLRDKLEVAERTAVTADMDSMLLFLNRTGYLEETYFIGQFIPLRGDDGTISGFYNTAFETTSQVLHARRRSVVDAIGNIPPCPAEETLARVTEALRSNPNDITMAMLYSVDDDDKCSGAVVVRLRGSIGVPENARCAPRTANLDSEDTGLAPLFRCAKDSGSMLVLSQADGSLPACGDLFSEVTWQGYGEPSRDIIVSPLYSGPRLMGFYVQGTNPRRPYDQTTEASIVDVTRQIVAKWVSATSTEEAKAREERLERSLTESERKMRRMARTAPVGMAQFREDQSVAWANDQYWEMMGCVPFGNVFDAIDLDHVERGKRELGGLLHDQPRIFAEFMLTRRWSPPGASLETGQQDAPAWVLAECFAVDEDGARVAMIYITDISSQKWAESVQERHAAAALLAKRRQEDFIDMVSHETRNPLTAMMQLADGISTSMDHVDEMTDGPTKSYQDIAEENVDAAKTILACCNHQKRIIDDVLILSRLESNMLSITPVAARPVTVVANTVKMFDGEARISDIKLEIVRDASYESLNVDYVLCDTSRLTQILINLISNSVKFTAKRPERKITIMYGAQSSRPPSVRTGFGELRWLEHSGEKPQNTALPRSKEGGSRIYLYFCVQDSGPGIKANEVRELFKRFSQANNKTHITYGGSGLGLFICRSLAEAQGGEVGVASRHGEGSVFGFYVEAMRVAAPDRPHSPQTANSAHATTAGRNDLPRLSNEKSSEPGTVETSAAQPTSKEQRAKQEGTREAFHTLLVEDNLVNQKVLAKQLQRLGHTVTVANHGKEALEILDATGHWRGESNEEKEEGAQFDIVLCDLEMPVMNGLECAAQVRAMEREHRVSRRLPIIAVTANVRQEQKDEAVAAGMDNVMPKPFTANELHARIRETVANSAQAHPS